MGVGGFLALVTLPVLIERLLGGADFAVPTGRYVLMVSAGITMIVVGWRTLASDRWALDVAAVLFGLLALVFVAQAVHALRNPDHGTMYVLMGTPVLVGTFATLAVFAARGTPSERAGV